MDLKPNPSFEDLLEVGKPAIESPLRMSLTDSRGPPGSGPPYYDWRSRFPELQILLDNFDDILEEAKTIQKVPSHLLSFFPVINLTSSAVDSLARGPLF
jgi:hypothetical protein